MVAGDFMNIDVRPIKTGRESSILVNETYNFDSSTFNKNEILDISPISITGEITKSNYGSYDLNLSVEGTLVLPCSVTLKPVELPFSIFIEGDSLELLMEIDSNYNNNNDNSIDIFPIIWENILMEIPMKVTCLDVDQFTSGDGWQLVTEEEEDINPELAKLKDLL